MNRRQFIAVVAAGALAGPASVLAKSPKLPTRKFGRTGLRVPILGFGSGSRFLMYPDADRALAALNEAIDAGITYIDTAASYGNGKSEEWIGRLMPSRRKEVILATKIPGRTADQARRDIEQSLKRLRTDHVEVLHIHALKDEADLAAIEGRDGALSALYEARDQKVARAIGITCHASPTALATALRRHDFDCTQMALNAGLARMADAKGGMKATQCGDQSFEHLALPVARRKKMGVIAMKVFGQEQLLTEASVENLLAYALSLPVSLASLGMPKIDHIRANVEMARHFTAMSRRDRRRLSESISIERQIAMTSFFGDHLDV